MVTIRRLEAENTRWSLEKVVGRAFLPLLVSVLPSVRHWFMEEEQVGGVENLVEADGTLLRAPALWMPKHESWFDFVAAPPLWKYVPGNPLVNGASREKYSHFPPLAFLIRWLMKPLFFEMARTSMMPRLSETEKVRLQEYNRRNLDRLLENYKQGIHVGIAPEGTSKSDGRISPIKSGAYNLSHVRGDDGVVEVVPCVPVGNTFDFLVGGKNVWGRRKYAIFFNFGKPFFYDPVPQEDGETGAEYVKRDIQHFAERVELAFLDLNTITASQICGDYLLTMARNSRPAPCDPERLEVVVARRVDQLRHIQGLYFDERLLDPDRRRERVGNLYRSLVELKYLSSWGDLQPSVILHQPDGVEHFKDNENGGNVLLYSANRLRQVAEVTPAVGEVLRTMLI